MTEHVSLAEIAEIVDLPRSIAPELKKSIEHEGYTVVSDWAGRPALTLKDAQRYVTEWRAAKEREEADRRERYRARDAAYKCQARFDTLAGKRLGELLAANPGVNRQGYEALESQARQEVFELVQDEFDAQAVVSLLHKPLVVEYEPGFGDHVGSDYRGVKVANLFPPVFRKPARV
jgi:hypothetical protein